MRSKTICSEKIPHHGKSSELLATEHYSGSKNHWIHNLLSDLEFFGTTGFLPKKLSTEALGPDA